MNETITFGVYDSIGLVSATPLATFEATDRDHAFEVLNDVELPEGWAAPIHVYPLDEAKRIAESSFANARKPAYNRCNSLKALLSTL